MTVAVKKEIIQKRTLIVEALPDAVSKTYLITVLDNEDQDRFEERFEDFAQEMCGDTCIFGYKIEKVELL